MASNDEYQQQILFKKEIKSFPMDGGVDGRNTWKITANTETEILWFTIESQLESGRKIVPITGYERNKT